jgi:hypothetical protein
MSLLSFRDIARIFEEIELRLIASLKRNLSRHKAEEEKEGFEWSAWQAEKLNNIDNFRKENAQIADEYVDVIDDETRQLMTDQFHEGEHTAEQSVIDVSESGVNVPDVPDVPAQPQPPEAPTAMPDDHFFGVNKPKMDKLMEDVTTLEKTALTAAVRNMDDVYRTTLNKVQLMMGTGSITLNEAIDLATRDFLDKGINCIVYADGRRVNIADYVRMALRTTSTRATLQGAAKRFAELGYDTVLISQYGGCSKTCEPWQGKVYIDDVFTVWNGERSGDFGKSNYCDKWFMLLSVAIRGGLFHPNCRHTMGQYIEGLTKIPQPIPAEKIREQRALEEKQRAMERKIRALKRKVEGTQDEKKVKEYKRKLREEQGKLREFIKEHDDVLRRDYSREKIYSGKGEPKQAAPRTEEAPVKATDTESKNPVPTDKEPNIPQPDNNVSEPENNVSKPENNENTMNFVQPEPIKPVQSNEDTDNAPTAAMTDEADEAVETAETTENVQETVKQPVKDILASESNNIEATAGELEKSEEAYTEVIVPKADDKVQSYRPVVLNKNDEVTFTRDYEVKAHKADNTQNAIYVSENVKIKPKKLHQIDKNISEAVDKMEITERENLPKIIVVSHEDMATMDVAVYRAIENQLLICEDMTVYKPQNMPIVMEQLACSENDLSSYVHELYHWMDAETYRREFGIVTSENYDDYIMFINGKAKNRLDKLAAKGYNIIVSKYASIQHDKRKYYETYTEFRVFQLLRGVIG